jgi:hypothetical protein
LIVLLQTNNYTLVLGAGEGRWGVWVAVLTVLASPWGFCLAGDLLPVGVGQLLIPVALGVLLALGRRVWPGRGGG